MWRTMFLWKCVISDQFGSVAQSCVTLCDPMDCSTPGFTVHYQLLELAQTHVHRVGDAIQPSHPLLSPSPPVFNLSRHQGMSQFFTSGGQSIGVSASASVFPMNIQDWFHLGWTGWISLQSKKSPRSPRVQEDSWETLLRHHSSKASFLPCSAFFIVQLSHPYMTMGKTIGFTRWILLAK